MITSIPSHSMLPAKAAGDAAASWKPGDIMPGTVVGGGRGNSVVSIGGNNYRLDSPLQFNQGEALMLKVAGLTPVVHFTLISRIRRNVGNSEVMTMSPAEKVLQGMSAPNQNLNGRLTSLVSLLHFGSAQPLPQASLLLIESLRRRLLRSEALKNPGQIRQSLATASLVSSGGGISAGAPAEDGGLPALLHQIVDSLAAHRALAGKLPVSGNYRQALGVWQYQSGDGEHLRHFTRSVEEQYRSLMHSKNPSPDELQQHPYRLFVELPVVFRDHIRSLSLRIATSEDDAGETEDEGSSSAEFELELEGCGWVYCRVSIVGRGVCYWIGCENQRLIAQLGIREQELRLALDVYGLRLEGLRSELRAGKLPLEPASIEARQTIEPGLKVAGSERSTPAETDQSLRRSLREAQQRGQMPELNEFELRLENRPVAMGTEIPIELYCAMAALFAQLLELTAR